MNRVASTAVCAAAMAAGLWLDTRGVPLEVLAAWCGDPDSPWLAIARHGIAMPASHVLMGVAAWAVPHATGATGRTAHAAAMLLGMVTVGLLGPALARVSGLSEAHALVAAMVIGMVLAGCLLPASRPSRQVPAGGAMGNPSASASRR